MGRPKAKKNDFNRLAAFEQSLLGSMFVLKIVRKKPEGVELARWLELIFGLHERDIIQYKTNRTFAIPGFYKPAPQVRISGYKIPRTIQQKQRLWARFDLKYPNVIDVEAPIGHGNEPRLFQLTREQWDHVKMWLIPVHQDDKAFHEIDLQTHGYIRTLNKKHGKPA